MQLPELTIISLLPEFFGNCIEEVTVPPPFVVRFQAGVSFMFLTIFTVPIILVLHCRQNFQPLRINVQILSRGTFEYALSVASPCPSSYFSFTFFLFVFNPC